MPHVADNSDQGAQRRLFALRREVDDAPDRREAGVAAHDELARGLAFAREGLAHECDAEL